MAEGRPNAVLRSLMKHAGLSAEDLAEAINAAGEPRFGERGNTTGRHVRRWLSGVTVQPQLPHLVGMMDTFGLEGADLGFTLSVKRSREVAQYHPASTLLVETTAAEEDHVLRRHFMLAGAGQLLSIAFAPLPTSGRMGASDVERIRQSVGRLHTVDDLYGGEQLADVAEQFVTQIEGAMGRCHYGPRVEKALYQVLGELHASAGWFSFDSGDQARASRNFDSALRASLLAGDRMLQARVWAYMSRQSWELGRATETVTTARAALDITRNARDHRLSALLHGRLALGYSAAGQGARCGTALARAETALDRIGDDPAAAWLAFVGAGEVMGAAAMAHMSLGQPDRAAYQEEQGMQLLDPRFRRNQFAKATHLAECYLAANRLEEAVQIAGTALSLYPTVNCPRWATHLGAFRNNLAGRDLPEAADFVERYDLVVTAAA
ncbi:hypothetical protein [Kitasatospora griseola]|uniref:hypothetical protein n=1 Tax=Kitasatospora griseola TaxID=2064 RepID=UPI00166FE2EB|nr:hypothetical protein [Kitasatospora griseola]GGQ94668.1 hypothetical protein GCM10010195_58170 [Kitasatospora griseola]